MTERPIIEQDGVFYEVPLYQYEMRKLAALAGDLRAVSFPKQHRVMTNPPTEGSKMFATKSLMRTQKIGTLKPPNAIRPFWKPTGLSALKSIL
jgi:hypothetical protein